MGLLLLYELLESPWWFVTETKKGTVSDGLVACCDRDEEGGETSITFPTLDDNDVLLPEIKVKNTNEKLGK